MTCWFFFHDWEPCRIGYKAMWFQCRRCRKCGKRKFTKGPA